MTRALGYMYSTYLGSKGFGKCGLCGGPYLICSDRFLWAGGEVDLKIDESEGAHNAFDQV